MTLTYSQKHKRLLRSIQANIPEKLQHNELITTFIREFYEHLPLPDLEEMDASSACQKALSCYSFFAEADKSQPRIRIYTPNKKSHGWDSNHAVIEIAGTDMPFIVDSVTAELNRLGFTIFHSIHPVYATKRNEKGMIESLSGRAQKKRADTVESLMHIEISSLPDDIPANVLEKNLRNVLRAVQLTVEDWSKLRAKTKETIDVLSELPSNVEIEEMAEAIQFLEWVHDNNFVFLGYIEYDFKNDKGTDELIRVDSTALGVFRLEDKESRPRGLEAIPMSVRHYAKIPSVIEITKANRKSLVHRPVHMDYITIKRYDKEGSVIGERRILGLFTSTVYYQSIVNIPILRHKAKRLLERAGFDPSGHNGKALKSVLESFPRDELFQTQEDQLFETCMGILSLEGRPRVRAFIRQDSYERFASCLVFVPRERFSTMTRHKIQEILEHYFNGTVTAHYIEMNTDSPMARLQVIVRTEPGKASSIDIPAIERDIIEAVNIWIDDFHSLLIQYYGEEEGTKVYHNYRHAFVDTYTNRYKPKNALFDIANIENSISTGHISLDLFEKPEDAQQYFRIKVFNPAHRIPLSDILPMLENMGLRVIGEYHSLITPSDYENGVWMRDFRLTAQYGLRPDIAQVKAAFEEALYKVWHGEVENDGFNKLVLLAGLNWREVNLLRSYAKYFKQSGFTYHQATIEDTLARHTGIARLIVEYFNKRFNPATHDANGEKKVRDHLMAALTEISSINDDRILRQYIEVMDATLRTNFFQVDKKKEPKPYVSFKLRSSLVPGLPLPHPFAEIFVYSPRIEGIHLRGAKVARGGLRWSDRHEDFRTEVLGLMKAQMVKNTVIVPEGSKGGFVVKQPPKEGGRDAFMQEGIACYKTFLSGLLDVTDNVVNGKVKPPKDVVRHDENDPYLVVAADKGTATFSDYANAISEDYGFWLGDAFASGGSVGYDHKKMGITARGAWVSVHRHFMEMGKDIQKEDFSVIGIGDMSGDVFGNGMLLSKHICLVGAFNHMHIFLDPEPDAAASFKERKRLFALPRSGWNDYDSKLISKGGGVFDRSEKSIATTPQIRKLLGITAKTLTPDALIQAMLKADVELLWNGGIGTYVKATQQSHSDVGDRTNDALRINARSLRCKVIGEGGNLGLTQLGRIEYAMHGGRINTDAIDNSAGVDCSDHEVNIKIALGAAMQEGKLTLEKRNVLLASMTEEVGELCLRDNVLQTQALTVAERQGASLLESQSHFMRKLERSGLLNREIEFLPDDESLNIRMSRRQGLTRPELSVVLAYSKLILQRELTDSKLPDDLYFITDLVRYFPTGMQKDFHESIVNHQLRRDIIATSVTNSIINRTGATFFHQISEDTGMKTCDIARAYVVTRDIFELRSLWLQIEALNGKVDVSEQVAAFLEINRFVYRSTLWLLRNLPQPIDISATFNQYQKGAKDLSENIDGMLSPQYKKHHEQVQSEWQSKGFPKALAHAIAKLNPLSSALDIVSVSTQSGMKIPVCGQVYFELGERLHLDWLRKATRSINTDTHWPRLAVTAMGSDLYDQQRRITSSVIKNNCTTKTCSIAVDDWCERHSDEIERYDQFIKDLRTNEHLDFSMLIVALRKVESIGARE